MGDVLHPLDILGDPSLQELVVAHISAADAASLRQVCRTTRDAGLASYTPGQGFRYKDRCLELDDDTDFMLEYLGVGGHRVHFGFGVSGSSGVSTIFIDRNAMTLEMLFLERPLDSLHVFLTPLYRVLCAKAAEYVTMFANYDPYPVGYRFPTSEGMLQHCATATYNVPTGVDVFSDRGCLLIENPGAWIISVRPAHTSGFYHLFILFCDYLASTMHFFSLSNDSLEPNTVTESVEATDIVRGVVWSKRDAVITFARGVMEAPIVVDLPTTVDEFERAVQNVCVKPHQ